MTTSQRPKVALLALTLEFYEQLAPALRTDRENWVRRDALPALAPHADVLFDRAVFRAEDIEAAVAVFEAAGADALLVLLLTYSPSQVALPALQRTRLPVVIWNTQELPAVSRDFSPADLRNNHGVHGTQDLANVLTRANVRFHYVTGHPRDAGAVGELRDFFTVARAVRQLRQARLGLLGYPFPGMGDFAVDTTQLRATLGCSWSVLTVEDYNQRAAAAEDAAVTELVAEYKDRYAVAADVTARDLEVTARAELALRGLVADGKLDALTYQFLAFGEDERTVTLPFVAASRLMAEGIGFGGEGDLIAAAASLFFHHLQPPASFSEMFTVDFAGNGVLFSHTGEANVAMARRDRQAPLVARPAPITRTRERQLALVTCFEPGPATLAALTPGPGGRWRILASPMTIEDFGPLPGFCGPHSKLRAAGDVREFLTAYAKAGGPHHNAVCFGDARRRLRLAAVLLDADYLEV
jgi:L-arabinose isomerase